MRQTADPRAVADQISSQLPSPSRSQQARMAPSLARADRLRSSRPSRRASTQHLPSKCQHPRPSVPCRAIDTVAMPPIDAEAARASASHGRTAVSAIHVLRLRLPDAASASRPRCRSTTSMIAVVVDVEQPHAVVAARLRVAQRLAAEQVLVQPLLRLAEGQELDLLAVLRRRRGRSARRPARS